jgi:hypothetical protein
MSKNNLSGLNDHLFIQLSRLSNSGSSKETLELEFERAKAISMVSKDIISTARLVLDARLQVSDIAENIGLPGLLE